MKKQKIIKPRNRLSYLIVLIFLLNIGCQDSQKKKNSSFVNDYEKIFSDIEFDNSSSKINPKIYEDSIIQWRNKIRNTANKIKQGSIKSDLLDFLKKDSLYFELELNNNVNLIYSSYNGFSEGSEGEKAIYCENFYIDKLKQHIVFLKGINYNLSKKQV